MQCIKFSKISICGHRGIRTHPESILSRLPLPLGYVAIGAGDFSLSGGALDSLYLITAAMKFDFTNLSEV